MGATTIQRGVRYEVRRARKPYLCDVFPCNRRIEPGRQYMHLTAMPGHDVAPGWDVIRECVDCAIEKTHPLFEHFTDYPT